MKKRLVMWGLVVGLLTMASITGAEEAVAGPEAAVRKQVAQQVAAAIGPQLPALPVAILPVEVAPSALEAASFVDGWETALAAALQTVTEVDLAERGDLEAILREQKLADSAYGDPATAAAVGKIVAARALVLTRLNEWRPLGLGMLVDLEIRLLDVETGQIMWAFTTRRTVWPYWLSLTTLVIVLLLTISGLLWLQQSLGERRRDHLVERVLPGTRKRLRIDLDGLVRALALARDRIHHQKGTADSLTVQEELVQLEPVLDRVRHSLPSSEALPGAVGLDGASRHIQHIAKLVEELRRVTDSAQDANSLARRLQRARGDLTTAIDAYRAALA